MIAVAELVDAGAVGLLLAAFFFGLRHGVDWDHIAAISDITASNESRRGLRLGVLYALGHGAGVLCLGVVALLVGRRLPPSVDELMGRVAGVTLLLLAAAVIWSLVQDRGQFRLRSRQLLLIVAVRRLARRFVDLVRPHRVEVEHVHRHVVVDGFHHDGRGGHDQTVERPVDDEGTRLRAPVGEYRHVHKAGEGDYTTRATLGIGMLHGVGAETPTQVIIFLAAANAGGAATGIAVLVVFLAGLFTSNFAITLLGIAGFQRAAPKPRVHVVLAIATSVVSVVVGSALVMGTDGLFPAVFST